MDPNQIAGELADSAWRRSGASRWRSFPAFVVIDDKGNDMLYHSFVPVLTRSTAVALTCLASTAGTAHSDDRLLV
jgi:hypothetical protein